MDGSFSSYILSWMPYGTQNISNGRPWKQKPVRKNGPNHLKIIFLKRVSTPWVFIATGLYRPTSIWLARLIPHGQSMAQSQQAHDAYARATQACFRNN